MSDCVWMVKAVKRDGYIFYSEKATEDEVKSLSESEDFYVEDIAPDENSIRLTDKCISLYEWKKYKVRALPGKKLSPKMFEGIGEYGTESFGVIKFKNRLGIALFDGIEIEVLSKKLSKDQYEKMTEIVNKYVSSLSYDFNQSTMVRINRNRSKHTDLEYHIYLLIMNALKTSNVSVNIFSNFELIKNNPHRIMKSNIEYVNVNEVSELGDETISEILSGELELRKCSSSNSLSRKLSRHGEEYIPAELGQEMSYDSFDNNENRFVRFFFEYCLDLIERFQQYFIQLDNYSYTERIQENKEYIGRIKNLLNNSFLRNVGEMRIIPVSSTVLTKKDGYRQLFKLFTGLKSIPETVSERDYFEIIENKSLDVIYENFCFFILADLLCDIYGEKIDKKRFKVTKNIFAKTLEKKSYTNYFEFDGKDGLPKVRLHYNKNYSGGMSTESYSKDYDPDISLEIFGDSEIINKIYMFDAKFKAVVFGDADDEDVVRLYKLDDISKMHAYKDAIKKGVGAFVLYPGNINKLYPEDNSLPYKGVGAFCLTPGVEKDTGNIMNVLYSILKGLNAAM